MKRLIEDKTDKLSDTALIVVERNQNIRRVLSELGKRWQLGGIEDEFDGMSGATCFWAQRTGKAQRVLIEIPNRRLNKELLSRVEISEYLNGPAKTDATPGSTEASRSHPS